MRSFTSLNTEMVEKVAGLEKTAGLYDLAQLTRR